MRRRIFRASALIGLVSLWIAFTALAQQRGQGGGQRGQGGQRGEAGGQRQGRGEAQTRPPLFFREDWKRQYPNGNVEGPADAKDNVTNPNLELRFYGEQPKDDPRPAGREAPEDQHTHGGMWMNHRDDSEPQHLFTGTCTKPCAMALRHKTQFANLAGYGTKIRWYVKTTGYHVIRPIVKLADGTWLVGSHTDGFTESGDWYTSEFSIADNRWRRLDINKVITATGNLSGWVNNPDLSKVDEIGFADLMPGSGHGPGGYSDFAWIEVYAKPVPR
jgi:hypothetical protein